jgi:hypothetical protein
MTMEKITKIDAIAQLLTSLPEANQAVLEGVVAAQEGNVKLAQSMMTNWLEALKEQTENAQTLMDEMEQQMNKQQEAVQRLTQQTTKRSFDFLCASFSSSRPSLRLTENLQICLLALASRYPHHSVDINEEVLGPQNLRASGWRAADLIELFQSTAPELLHAKARLEVNASRKGIYLLERSEQTPALWVHCGTSGEKTPASQGDLATRRQEQATRR